MKWTGAKYCSLGMVIVPKDKRVKAVHDLLQLLEGTMTVGDLRSLNGLLEFIMAVVMFKRNRMQGMYDPFQAGREAEWGPETQAWVTKLVAQSSNAWITTLSAGCAAPFIAALECRDLLRFESFHSVPPSAILYGMTSDASKEGADIPGIGGYFCGLWWTLALDSWGWLWDLDIPALELLGFGINLVVFDQLLRKLVQPTNNMVIAYIDAKASPQLLVKQDTTSWVMARVLSSIQGLVPYQQLKLKLVVAHTAGEGNLASDDCSRGEFNELAQYCAQVGVKPRQLELSAAVWSFLGEVKTALEM